MIIMKRINSVFLTVWFGAICNLPIKAHADCFSTPQVLRRGICALDNGSGFALLVGVGNANMRCFPRLRSVTEEIKQLEQILCDQGYFVISLTDNEAIKEKIFSSMQTIAHRAHPQDKILFYFSGHGMIQACNNEAALVVYHPQKIPIKKKHCTLWQSQTCPDCFRALPQYISFGELVDSLTHIDVEQHIVLIDACYGARAKNPQFPVTGGYHPALVDRAMFSVTAWDTLVDSRIYSPVFFDALRGAADIPPSGNNDSLVEAGEFVRYVNSHVRQLKFEDNNQYYPHIRFVGSGTVILTSRKKY